MRFEALFYRAPGPGRFELGPLELEGPDDRPWLLLGLAGSGKTTLLRLLGGALTPLSGRILGLEPGHESTYLPQLPERALAGRNLAEDLCGVVRPGSSTRGRLRAALRAVGLQGVALSARSRRLSTGERRRLSLALLSLSPAACWAVDEPDAGLDATGRTQVVNWLGAEARRRRLWIATHRWEHYGSLDPWVLVLDAGRERCSGGLGEVSRRPEVRELLVGEGEG